MKRTTLVGTVAGIIIVGGGLAAALHFNALNQQKVQTTQAIVDVFTESNRDVQEMQAIVSSHAENADKIHAMSVAVPAMTAKMRAIDTSKCPADFQQTYLRYRQAWEGVGQKMAQLPQTNIDSLAQTLTGVLFGNSSEKSNDQISTQSDELRSAANDLEAVALRYSVHVSVMK